VHNSTPEYASTACILKLFEKKFLKKWFSPQISSKPLRPQETELKEKREKRRKARKVSLNKGEVNILRGEWHFNFKNPFWCDLIFSPSIIPFQKPFPKSLRKNFLPFLDHPLAWQYRWLELYPFSLPMSSTYSIYRGRMRRNNCWAKVRNHIPKRVLECLMLRNHSIIAIIFSLIDFKRRLGRRDNDKRFHLSSAQDKAKNSTKAPWGE
jgi:hypothetical protein